MDCLVYGHIGWHQLCFIDDRKRTCHTSKQTTEDGQPELIDWLQGMSARDQTAALPNRFSTTLAEVERSLRDRSVAAADLARLTRKRCRDARASQPLLPTIFT